MAAKNKTIYPVRSREGSQRASTSNGIKFISALLIVSMITPAVLLSKPKQTKALSQTGGSSIVGAAVCKGSGFLSTGIGGLAGGAIGNAVGNLTGLGTSVPVSDSVARGLLGTIAKTTSEDTCTHTWENVFEYVIKETLKLVARRLLAKLTQATINWINSDFHGSPLFLENPRSFFRDVAKSEVRNMVDMIGYDTLRHPFGKRTALNIIDSYKRQLEDNAEYTLSKVIKDADFLYRYQNDFDFGGWNGFLINTQYPQNNYLGFKMMIEENLASRVEGTMVPPAQVVKDALQQGMGFLSPQTCPSNPKYNNVFNEFRKPSFQYPDFDDKTINEVDDAGNACTTDNCRQEAENRAFKKYNEERDAKRAKWAEANSCPGGLVSTTPGSVAANQIMTALGSPMRSLELDAALGNSVAAILDALINHFFDKGLNALADFVNPQPSFNDNWSYRVDGRSYNLGDDNDISGNFGIPDDISVSVRVGETTSARLPAGDYSIQSQTNESATTVTIDVSGSSGIKLIIEGKATGTNIVTIQYSSDPTQTFDLTITVGEIGGLLVSPASIVTNAINKPIIATISGGNGDYSLRRDSDESVAMAVISGANLIVTAIADGKTGVRIQDSSDPVNRFDVDIRVGPEKLTFAQSSISVNVGDIANVHIENGKGLYTVTGQENTQVAWAEILDNHPNRIQITGLTAGTSLVTIEDSSDPVQTANIFITTKSNSFSISSSISVNADEMIGIPIRSGKGLYTVTDPGNTQVAKAEILTTKKNRLTITGIASGTSLVTVQDSSVPNPQTANIFITTKSNSLSIPLSISVNAGDTKDILIENGKGLYTVTDPGNTQVAKAEILTNPNRLTITGIASGTSLVTVKDSSNPARKANIIITTIATFIGSPPTN